MNKENTLKFLEHARFVRAWVCIGDSKYLLIDMNKKDSIRAVTVSAYDYYIVTTRYATKDKKDYPETVILG